MAARVGLSELLPEAKTGILRCICGGAESLPAYSLRAMACTSSEWLLLSTSCEVFPYLARLVCELLTPSGPCKRDGRVWQPADPLQPQRTKLSQATGELDFFRHFLHSCLSQNYSPARALHTYLVAQPNLDLGTWLGSIRRFRETHFGHESGLPQEGSPEGDSPPPVWCAVACALPERRVCVVGGGCYNFELMDAQTHWTEVFWHQPQVYVFDVPTRMWSQPPVTGPQPPAAHTYATANSLIGNDLLMWCGGYYAQAFNTAYSLDVDSWVWQPYF